MVRGWYQCCCGLNGFLGGSIPLVFPRWQREDGARMEVPACLSGTQTEGGFFEAFEALGLTRERRGTCPPSGQ